MTTLLITETVLVANSLISPIITIASGLVKSISYLTSISYPDIELQKIINESDLTKDVEIIKSIVSEHSQTNITKSIQLCLENLSSILQEIDFILTTITEKMKRHKKKWFHNYRAYNITNEKISLIILIQKLHHRFEIYIKVRNSLHNV
jgi:hypothetical protein